MATDNNNNNKRLTSLMKKKSSKRAPARVTFNDRLGSTLIQAAIIPGVYSGAATVEPTTTRTSSVAVAVNGGGPEQALPPQLPVIDVEEQLELNRGREKERLRKQKRRRKKKSMDDLHPGQLKQQETAKPNNNKNKKEEDNNDIHEDHDDDDEDDDEDDANRTAAGGAPNARLNKAHRTAVTAIQGRKTVRLTVLPIAAVVGNAGDDQQEFLKAAVEEGVIQNVRPKDTVPFSSPARLLDIEGGAAVLVTNQKLVQHHEFEDMTVRGGSNGLYMMVVTAKALDEPIQSGEDEFFLKGRGLSLRQQIESGDVRDFETNPERGIMGGAWRGILRRIMMWSLNDVNGLRMGRQLQVFVPYLTGYEAYLVGQVIEALDGSPVLVRKEVNYVFTIAFKNRNVSRFIVQNVGPRWDFLWHWFHQVCKSRLYDAVGRFPVIGFTGFPATENFPNTRNHALASTFRLVLGPGNWITRVLTQNRQGLDTDDPERNVAQNLAAETTGFELANRNQFGTMVGRLKTNQFRIHNRLTTDEAIVRTFFVSPMSTMVNNGVVHVLRQMAMHWHNTLNQQFGGFAHQRMEQLDPLETMRFHMPLVCVVLSSLRGRNLWDAQVLGPFLKKCQHLNTSFSAGDCRRLAKEMKDTIVLELSAGVATVAEPLASWLDAIQTACTVLEEEAKIVYKEITGVEIGLRLGYDLITQVSWKVPSDKELRQAILLHLQGKNPGALVGERRIRNALLMTTPRDKRTLVELVKHGLVDSKPAKLLMGRVRTLLKREIRREYLNEAIRELSMGEIVQETSLRLDDWYWLEEKDKKSVYVYAGGGAIGSAYRFVHVDSGVDRFVTFTNDYYDGVRCRLYIPVAESIVRAQRCYMNLELDHGHKFKYTAFMEFSFLRTALRRLAVISQIFCEELDNARLNVLREVQKSNQVRVEVGDLEPGTTYYIYDSRFKIYAPFVCKKKYTKNDPEYQKLERVTIVKIPPQSMIVVGGGPVGLMTVIHCTENVLTTGGEMKLYESRDAFAKGGCAFERAQIVRIDARWIAMLRYHLGTIFEDMFIPASGETDAQLGNSLPTQGFLEITIKDLECMLHVEVSRLWSKGVIEVFTESKAQYDVSSNSLTKQGEQLKIGDKILRRVDPNGKPSAEFFRWKVQDLKYVQALGLDDLRVGEEYGVYVRQQNGVLPFKLVSVDLQSRTYNFKALKKKIEDLNATAHNLPSVYPKGTDRHADVETVVVESVTVGDAGGFRREQFSMDSVREERFTLDIGHTHVVECIGKPQGSKVHFQVTTAEPYGVCCIQGLKISMGMHNFGEKRWGQGLLDDFRSTNDQNTRIIGGFTKVVRQPRIAEEMNALMKTENWQLHFEELVEDSKFRSLNDKEPIVPKLLEAVQWHAENARSFRRQTLQTRFFETGDNYYLGMEFTREYDKWKNETADKLVFPLTQRKKMTAEKQKFVEDFRGVLKHNIDRLWYEACLEVIRQGDVYNPGARRRVPRLHLINSYIGEELRRLAVGESFRITDKLGEKYEVLVKKGKFVMVRNVEGMISKLPRTTEVFREGDLTRSPDGNTESKVGLSTFPVAHCVNHRSIRLNNETRGYVFAFIGDEQAVPHFMRYSGLTGGCINAMQFNNFIKFAIEGKPFIDRFRLYSQETNWSNGEVVARGCMANFGEDGFLRPGFSYADGLTYLYSKVIEWMETKQDMDDVLSQEWLAKFAASMIPRGMELNEDFIGTLIEETQGIIFNKFLDEVKNDRAISSADRLEVALTARKDVMSKFRSKLNFEQYWTEFLGGLAAVDDSSMMRLQTFHCTVAKRTEQVGGQIIDFAKESYLYGTRFNQELHNQPKPVDSIVDDFAVEAQNFANALALSAAFSAASVAFVLYDLRRENSTNIAQMFGAIIAGFNILLSFGTMTNIGRYKIRNEEARILFFDNQFMGVKKAAFSAMDNSSRKRVPGKENPFLADLESKKQRFVQDVKYYNLDDPDEFLDDYSTLREQINQPAAIKHFQKLVSTYYIADAYHVNSYLQEDLVAIYKACEGILAVLTSETNRTRHGDKASHLFERIMEFGPRLEQSLQRGHIYWGFLKQRKIRHWDIFILFRYFWSLMCCSFSRFTMPLSSIENETYGIIREARVVYDGHKGVVLKREIRDLEYLYWATRESDIASMIFVSASLNFVVSIIFTISRIITAVGGPDTLTEIAFWATLASAIGAILAAFHFFRKFSILFGLWFTLGGKVAQAKDTAARRALGRIKGVTFTQLLLTFARLGAALGSAVALPWSVAQNAFPDKIGTDESIPLWIALGSFGAAVGSTIFFFLVEFIVRYNLSPQLGEYVCEAFREEIKSLYQVLSVPENTIETKQVQERKTWEYVARDFLHTYRFDTVFAADRFGSILQYIQGGMKRVKSKKDKSRNSA